MGDATEGGGGNYKNFGSMGHPPPPPFPKVWVAGGSPSLLSPLVGNPVILPTPSLLWKKIDPPPSWAN